MLKIRFENLFEKICLVFTVSLLIQLMLTIGASHQKSIDLAEANERPHIYGGGGHGYLENNHKEFHLRVSNLYIYILLFSFFLLIAKLVIFKRRPKLLNNQVRIN